MNAENEQLPREMAALEQALAGGPALSATLRQRVLSDVEMNLRASARGDFWKYAAAVAATVLVLLNVSFSGATISRSAGQVDSKNVAAARLQVERMGLELSQRDAAREAILLAAGSELVPMGRPSGSAGGAFQVQDR